MRLLTGFTSLTCWAMAMVTTSAFAQSGPHGEPMARYVVQKGQGVAAPEIDGPGGVAAIALLVSVGLIAYNRFRSRG
jgi:hypothetical protein